MESKNEVDQWCMFHDYDFRQYKGEQRVDKIARNLVDYEAGLTIFNIAKGIEKQNNINQTNLF
jgi:DNA (cytosine-5)-methyltransferase 1